MSGIAGTCQVEDCGTSKLQNGHQLGWQIKGNEMKKSSRRSKLEK